MIKKSVLKSGLKSEKQDKILEVFYENPHKKFTIRELEKLTKLPKTTIAEYLKQIKRRKLLDQDSLLFKIKKTNYFVEKLISIGLIDFLIEKLNPSCIILFGSIRKGESNKESDADLFIETYSKNKVDLSKFEKKFKHKISIFNETKITKLPNELFNNVVNGIKIYGSFKIK